MRHSLIVRTLVRTLAPGAAGLLVLIAAAVGAADGTVTVTVRDGYGVVPRAAVHATELVSGETRRALTDAQGVARIAGLATGRYAVVASFPGFADARAPELTLGEGEERSLELELTLAQLSTSITVETANRREQLLLDVAQPMTLIERAQIADTGARSAKDVLVEQAGAGVFVNAGGGQGHLSINGIPNKGVLVLVNGRRYLGRDANGNLNLEELQLPGVERVEVVKGAGSALYGSDAMGGVVNFITSAAGERGLSNELTLSAGSFSDYRADDVFGWRGTRGGVGLSGGYRSYDGFDLESCTGELQRETGCRPNPQTVGQPKSRYWNASANADMALGSRLVARFFGDYELREVRDYFFSGATQLASTVYDSQRDLLRYTLSPELGLQLGPRSSLELGYTWGRYDRDETRVFVADGRVLEQPEWREANDELRLVGRHAFAARGREHPLQGGYEHRSERLRRGSLSVASPERSIDVAWAQQELDLGRVRLSGGVRYDHYSDFGDEWSPKAELVVTLAERQRLRGSYGQGFRPPYFGELYLRTPPFFVGNPELKPELSEGFTAGYAFAGGAAQLSLDGYYTKVRNGIAFFQEAPGRFTYRNLDRYTSRGVNLAGSLALPWGLTPSVSYTYNERETPDGAEVGGYPNHSAFLKLLYTNPRLGLRANLRGQLNGEMPPGVDGTYQPAYTVWYAQVSKRFAGLGRYALRVYAQVDNLFNEDDVYLANADGTPVTGQFQVWLAPRAYQVGVTLELD